MNLPNKKKGPTGIPQPLRQPGHAKQINSVAQAKFGLRSQKTPRPVAPPVYSPQPTPKVLQAKTRTGPTLQALPITPRKHPAVAPPLYQPQAPPKVLQLKKPVCVSGRRPVAPSIDRKFPTPKVLQPATTAGGLRRPVLAASHALARPAVATRQRTLPIMQRKLAPGVPAPGGRNLIQMAHDKKAKGFTPMDLKKASYSTVTAMLYIDSDGDNNWECHGKFTSDKHGHAEEQVIAYLCDDVFYGEDGDAKVVIELTTSPCGPPYKNCAGKLMKFKKNDAASRGIASVTIKALGFYKGAKDAIYDAAEIKSVEGMDFEVWEVLKEMREQRTAQGYNNSVSLESFAGAFLYQEGRKVEAIGKSEYNQEKFAKVLMEDDP